MMSLNEVRSDMPSTKRSVDNGRGTTLNKISFLMKFTVSTVLSLIKRSSVIVGGNASKAASIGKNSVEPSKPLRSPAKHSAPGSYSRLKLMIQAIKTNQRLLAYQPS